MSKSGKRFLKVYGIGAVLVCVTLLCKTLSLHVDNLFLSKSFVYLRDFIFIGLFFFWGLSVNKRIMQTQVRRMLLAVAALMLGWFLVRELKFRFVINLTVNRYLWYFYYIPLLLVPILALFISMSLEKPENYRLPKWNGVFFCITFLLIGLMLTNDLHQFAFHFNNPELWDEWHYDYGWLYYVVSAWIYLCSLLSFAVMSTKLRQKRNRKLLWIPIMPVVAALIYGVLYIIQNGFIHELFGDISPVFCLVYIAYFESCIRCSLIQSNSRYEDLFFAGRGINALITDNEYHLYYKTCAAEPLDEALMRAAEPAPIVLKNKTRLCNTPIHGGHSVWTEDIAELLTVKEALETRREELSERNALLQLEYAREKKHKQTEEQNRLYDLLQSKTQSQLDRIEELIAAYMASDSEEEKKRLLAKIIVLGSFIKRRKNFVLTADENELIPENMLNSALNESFRALRLLGIRGTYRVDSGEPLQKGEKLILAYDFFEWVIEHIFDSARYITVQLTRVNACLRLSITTDIVLTQLESDLRFTTARFIAEEDGTQILLPLEGGEEG